MKKSKVKLTPVFQTKEQEELFARCAQESMHKTMTGEISYLSIDESMDNAKTILSPVFQTKEQEELFAKIAQETMLRYMNEESVTTISALYHCSRFSTYRTIKGAIKKCQDFLEVKDQDG